MKNKLATFRAPDFQHKLWKLALPITFQSLLYSFLGLVDILMVSQLGESEIAAVGLAAIFIPYPFAVDDHQTANANILVRADAAILMPQTQLSALTLSQNIRALQSHPLKLVQMAAAALTCAAPQAADKVAQHCMEIARG